MKFLVTYALLCIVTATTIGMIVGYYVAEATR